MGLQTDGFQGVSSRRFNVWPLIAAPLFLGLVSGCALLGPDRPEPAEGDLVRTVTRNGTFAGVEGTAEVLDRWTSQAGASGELQLLDLEISPRRGSTVTLALVGEGFRKKPKKSAAETVAVAFERATLDLQNRGVEVRGLHLDLRPRRGADADPEWREAQASLIRRLRSKMSSAQELSATMPSLDPDQLALDVEALAPLVEWVLIDVYGQEPSDIDQADLWDLEAGLDRLRVVRAAEVASRGLVRVYGSAKLVLDGRAVPVANSIPCDAFQDLALRSESVFQFEGFYRQVFEVNARGETLELGDQRITVGDVIRLSRATPSHLRKLQRSAAELNDPASLGFIFEGLSSAADDCLGFGPDALEISRADPAPPAAAVERLGRGRFRVTITGGQEPTGFGRRRYNYLDVTASGGGLIREVEPGSFARFEFLDAHGQSISAFSGRGARLYVPLLSPGQSAVAEVRLRNGDAIKVHSIFRSPIGEELDIAVASWPPPAVEAEAPSSS